jgi:hypothetical protein
MGVKTDVLVGLTTRPWVATVTGAGPHTLLPSKINRFDNTAGAAMVLRLPVATTDGEEVELLEVGGSTNNVTLTTAAGTTGIYNPSPTVGDFANSFVISGEINTTPPTVLSKRVWGRYKWDATAGNWKVVGLYQPVTISLPAPP